MLIGRKLFYDMTTGEIVIDLGEMSGNVKEMTTEQALSLMKIDQEEFGKSIDVIKFEYGESPLEDIYLKMPFFKVNPSTKGVKFYGYGSYQTHIPSSLDFDKYSRDDLVYFYNQYIHFNLMNLLEDPVFKLEWVTIDDIDIRPVALDKNWDIYYNDPYLTKSNNDKTILGRDVLENGTFWPMVTGLLPEHEGKFIFEGIHRTLSLKLLNFVEPFDRKFLSIFIDAPDYFRFKGIYYMDNPQKVNEETKLSKPIKQRIPYSIRFGDLDPDSKEVLETMKHSNITFVDDRKDFIEVEAENYIELLSLNQCLPHWLRDLFFNYNESHDDKITPSDVLNNENVWNIAYKGVM